MAGGRYGWFPGHMAKALRQMEQRLKMVDLVVEVRDARVPLSSANPDLDTLARHKRRLVVLNKVDLADGVATQAACSLLRSQGLRVVPCMALRDGSAGKVLDAALSWLHQDRPGGPGDLSLLLVAGMPNTGKSSLINALKRAAKRDGLLEFEQAFQKTARAGPQPGVTRQMGGFKVCRDPLLYVLDTPGVLTTSIRDQQLAVRLALAGMLPAGPGGLDEGVLLRHLMQMWVAQPAHQRQLWAAADGHLPPPAASMMETNPARAARAAAAASSNNSRAGGRGDGSDSRGGGGGGGVGFGARRRAERATGLARLVYEVVSTRDLPQQRWHPGMDEQEGDDYDQPHDDDLLGSDQQADSGPGSLRDAERRVSELLRRMTRGSYLDVSGHTAAQHKVLQAFREGALGRYTLDDVGQYDSRG